MLGNQGETCCETAVSVPRQSKIIDKFRSRKESLLEQLKEVDNAISLLEKNPELESLFTSMQRVGIY